MKQPQMETNSPEITPITQTIPRGFYIACALLVAAFSPFLLSLAKYSFSTELHSHALLVPILSACLIWQLAGTLPAPKRELSAPAILLGLLGIALVAAFFILRARVIHLALSDQLTVTTLAFVCFFSGLVLFFFGKSYGRSIAFPLAFLIFLAPLPQSAQDTIEVWLQHASADALEWMLQATSMTYARESQVFHMPGLDIRVAQECSGVRSSYVLLISSFLAAHMFLHSPWRKALLIASVFPLAIARNAFRIWTLCTLTIHWDPNVITGPLHHRGGPIFFCLSLIPFFGLLLFLRRRDLKEGNRKILNGESKQRCVSNTGGVDQKKV